ncbi:MULTISPECIES: AIDA-I family autotransporter adhesin YfaL/EhaC [Enterobacterales]|uniref:AIDA-I family autotransporter adhesin YfaL/EhaC n=1 Tax=Enterobacterales TaxID=91347 RepID=UPI002EDA73FE
MHIKSLFVFIPACFVLSPSVSASENCYSNVISETCHAPQQAIKGANTTFTVADDAVLQFENMNATGGNSGGAVALSSGASFTIQPEGTTGSVVFDNNHADSNGGAIFAKENSSINISNALFSNNSSKSYGGAIYLNGKNDPQQFDLVLDNTIFENNIAQNGKGGAIYALDSNILISDSVFDNNQALSSSTSNGNGGALDITSNVNNDIFTGAAVLNNMAFTDNQAEGKGGAIYTDSESSPYLVTLSVDKNYTDNDGVAVYEGNQAFGYGDTASAAAGGFMYVGHSVVTMDVAEGKTMVIGDVSNPGAMDSIAGTGVIVKMGEGDVVFNADNNSFTGLLSVANGTLTLNRDNSLMNVGETACESDPLNCTGLVVGDATDEQAKGVLNVGSTQQTFVNPFIGYQNGTLNIDAGGNVTVNDGHFTGTIQGEGDFTVASGGDYSLIGADSLALTGDIIVDDHAVLSISANSSDITALTQDPQSVVLNGGVLDLSDMPGASPDSAGSLLAISGTGGTVIGNADVVNLTGGSDLHIGGDEGSAQQNGVYVVVNAGEGSVALANDNEYLGDTQIASGTLLVSDNSQLGDTSYNRSVIFTDPQQTSVLQVTNDVDTWSDESGHERDLEMRADGEVRVDDGVTTEWGALNADSTGNMGDVDATFSKTGNGTLTLMGKGSARSAVRVEQGTLLGGTADIFPLASSLWVGDEGTFITGEDQHIQSIDTTSQGNIVISDDTSLTLTNQDTQQALDASLFSGGGTLVNMTAGMTLTGTLNTNLTVDTETELAGVTVNGDVTNTFGTLSLSNGYAGDTLTINGDYNGGGVLKLDSVLGDDDSASDMLVLNGNTSGTTTMEVTPVGGIGQPTQTGIQVVDFVADPSQYHNDAQFTLAGDGYVNMGAYDYTLVKDNQDWYLRSQVADVSPTQDIPVTPDDPDGSPTPDFTPVLNPKLGGYFNNLHSANDAFVMRHSDHAGGQNQKLHLRVEGNHSESTFQHQLDQSEDTSVVQLSADLLDISQGEQLWSFGAVAGYSNNSGDSHSSLTGRKSDNDNQGYSVGLTASWYQRDQGKTGAYVDSWAQYVWFDNHVNEQNNGDENYRSSGLLASVEAGYSWQMEEKAGWRWTVQPQAQVIYQGVSQNTFMATNNSVVEQNSAHNVQSRLGLHNEWTKRLGKTGEITPYVDVNYLHNTEDASLSVDEVNFADGAGKDVGEVSVGVKGKINDNVSLWGKFTQQYGTSDYSQRAGSVGVSVRW